MDKDTKQPESKQAPAEKYIQDDYYEDDDDDSYYFNKAFKSNIKDDPASVRSRPRNIPVSKLQITDEDLIPKMPEKILSKPDKKVFDEKMKELDAQIKKKGESIQAVRKQKAEAKYGKNDEINKVYEEHKKLKTELDVIKAKFDKEELPMKPIRDTIDAYNADLRKFERYHFSTSPAVVANDIKQIQESLSFSELSLSEEKKLTDRKAMMTEYYGILKKLKEIKDSNKAALDASYKRRSELKEKYKPLDELSKKIKEFKEKKEKDKEKKKEQDDPVINQFNMQLDLLFKEREQMYIEKDNLFEQRANEEYEYNNQQNLIDYIKRAKEKINHMKKAIEKDKKKKEKMEKKGEKSNDKGEDMPEIYHVPVQEMKNDKQIANCDFLASYFSSLIPKEEIAEMKQQVLEKTGTKLDEDISKGLLKEVKKDDSENMLGLTQDPKKGKKKKGKKPTENKFETINVDFNIVNKIKEAGLAPPAQRSEIPKFLEEVAKKKQEFVKDNVAITLIQNIKKTDAESAKEGETALDA